MKRSVFIRIIAFVAVVTTLTLANFALSACTAYSELPDCASLDRVLSEGGYKIVWRDEFEGTKIDRTKWRIGYSSAIRNAGYYTTDEEQLFVRDGALTIRNSYRENGKYGSGWYTAWLETSLHRGQTGKVDVPDDYQGFSSKYGYYEVRCVAPPAEGIWSAFWMMPDEGVGMTKDDVMNTGSDGSELDIMESPYYYQAGEKNLCTHVVHSDGYKSAIKSVRSETYRVPDFYTEFHTYGLLWTEKEYVFFIDGKETWRTNCPYDGVELGTSAVDQFIILSCEVAGCEKDGTVYPGKKLNEDGSLGNFWCGNPDKNDKTKNYDFIVDYVRVWQNTAAEK